MNPMQSPNTGVGKKLSFNQRFTEIDVNTYKGHIPPGNNLVIMERDDEASALVLYGFDEIGMFDTEFKFPVYGFLK